MNLNILSSIELNRLTIPSMIKRKMAKLHVGSIASNEAVGSLATTLLRQV